MKNWYQANTGNGQGLIIEESTGDNIAVTYDEKNAPLVTAAPELLRALIEAEAALRTASDYLHGCMRVEAISAANVAKAVIAMTEGE